MYRAIRPNGELQCDGCEATDRGVELRHEDDALLAFVPYENMEALLTAAYDSNEPSIQ